MKVRYLTGNLAGRVVEMDRAAAQSAISSGLVVKVEAPKPEPAPAPKPAVKVAKKATKKAK